MRNPHIVAVAVAGALTACSDPKLKDRVGALEQQNSELKNSISRLETNVLQLQIDTLPLSMDMARVSTIDPGYGIAKSDLGTFTISVDKAEPYLAGFKLTLRIGNPSAATFDGATLKIRWQPAAPAVVQASAGTAPPPKDMAEREIKVTDKLRPGTFNKVEVVLSPVKAEDIKSLWIGIVTDHILLNRG